VPLLATWQRDGKQKFKWWFHTYTVKESKTGPPLYIKGRMISNPVDFLAYHERMSRNGHSN
jgi:hypothetical protein